MADDSEAGVLISATELSAILAAPPPNETTIDMVANMVERINNTLYGWNNGLLEPVEGSNMASFSTVQEFAQNINTYNEIAKDKGFSSYIDAYNFASGQINQISDLEEEAGVCAVVRIRIQQELAITREAFLARLQIENMEDSSLEQINIEIIITDLFTGELSTSLFSIGNGTLSGSLTTSINGQWMLPSDRTGAVEWLIIPYSEAAPDSNRIYNVGGSLSYLLGSENITVPLSPTPITVTPDPSLLVHYFWERNVVADNPFTDVVEPSVPFTLGVAVKNAGYGTAYSLQISSAQPEIIDNERGLLISFMIIGANIGGERATPSLTVRFGDLAPNTTMVARWYMISSLQGEFMSYTATFENMNPLGDPKLSVLDDLQIHELIRNVMIYTSNEEDGIPDFLVNDQDDYLAYPDTLYSSKTLQQYNISVGTVLSVQMNIMTSSLAVRTLTNSTGWVYYRYEDTQGILNTTALSVNGTKYAGNQMVVLPSENSWITSDRDETTETETFYLHILDYVEITDEVLFILNPCTDDCPTLGLPFTRPTVQLPTPSVSVTAPAEVMYAGTTTPLTLICNVTIDPSLADSVDVAVIWLRETAQLSNTTDRVSISSLSQSLSIFTSTLTVYPLSIMDTTNFTCRAGVVPLSEGGLSSTTPSDLGEGTVFIVVEVPPAPIVNIAASSDPMFVGESLNLACSAMVVPHELINDPVLTWSGPGVDQTSAQLSREALNLSLSFSPLLTSQAGIYVCTARLAIPEAGINVMATQEITVYAQIPPPILTITGSPRDTDFFLGLDLTFSCNIELSSGIDSPIMVQSIWWKNETVLENSDDGRITVTNVTEVMPQSVFQTTVRLNPMDFDDADTYMCAVTVIPLNNTFIDGISDTTMRNITDISSFPAQNVIVTDEGVSTAGYPGYSLLCTVTREQDLSSLTTIFIQWLDPSGLEISGDQAINVNSSGSANDAIVTSRLIFNSLLTSQAGEYTCRTSMSIPGTEIFNYTVDEAFPITVKLPAPEASVIIESREAPLYEGTTFSLSCLITPNRTGVDTEFAIQRSFIGPETSATERISLSDTVTSFDDIQLSYSFFPLILNDTGIYECSAIALSTIPNNLTASDPVINGTTLSILELPAPEVNIYSAVSQPIAGNNHTLICSAIIEDYLVASPTLKWILIDDVEGASESTSANSSALALNFHPLRTSHGGSYTCEATLEILQADIDNLTSSSTENVTVQISAPVLSIVEHPIPYNGTIFTLSGVASLDPSVDTDVTAVGVWSAIDDVGTVQVSTSPPYQTNLEFQPLATDSSDEYILNVTFRPSDDSPFIAESIGSLVYNLVVQPLPPRPPTISVTSRYPSFDNDCGEARIFDCTTNPVENLFIPPNVTWIGPDDNEVPVGGDSNPMINPQTGQLIFSDITSTNSGQYVCRAIVTISVANISDHFDDAATSVNTNAPGPVTNLMCNKTSLSSTSGLYIFWELPTVLELGDEVIGYQVEIKELQHKDGTKDVVSVDITDFNTKLPEASINEGLTDMVPYEIRVKALNVAGCGEQQKVYCFTQEGEPPSPKNVVVYKINSTAINVTWDKQTLVELKGLADYTVEYSMAVSNRKRQILSGVVTVPWTESNVLITNLTPGVQYDVSVSVATSVGMSDQVRGMLRDVSTTPPSVAKETDIGIIIGSTALVLVIIIAVAVALIIAITIAIVVRKRKDEYKLRSSLSLAVSGERLSSISFNNYSYKDPCDDEKQKQQQSSL